VQEQSYPYGYPTARELKTLICDEFSNPNTAASRLLGDNSDYSPDEFCGFKEAFLRSGQPSIDAFLERRPNFLGVGKLAIAYCLVPFEDERKLYQPDPNRGGDWYEYLSVKLNTSFEEFGNNKLSVITFNYDHSVEHYLLTSLQNLYGKPFDECAKLLAQIPIIHVYGQLGRQPYPQPGCHLYEPNRQSFADVALAAEGITLLHEGISELHEARRLLHAAEKICFLGFSFHPLNVSRLAIETQNAGSKSIFGTARGLVGGELTDVERRTHSALGSNIVLHSSDNLETLRMNMILG